MLHRSILFLFFTALLLSVDSSIVSAQTAASQEVIIDLFNPSFEDMPRASRPPRGWANCGFPNESPPDTQPDSTFKVFQAAVDGNSYLGMVTRDNDTWEAVTQRLSQPMQGGKCYSFSIFLARSESYWSQSKITRMEENYDTPSLLRIWGGAGRCDRRELLAETSVITHTRWLEYNFKFSPAQTHTYLLLEAIYRMPTLFPTNGNLLIDHASPIVMMPCSEDVNEVETRPEEKTDPPVAEARINRPGPEQTPPPVKPTPKPPQKEVVVDNTPRPAIDKEVRPEKKPAKRKILEDLDRNKIKEGQIIQISQLFFDADTFALRDNSFEVLDEIYNFLKDNPKVMVEIGGHTNGIPETEFCNWLSEKRAKEVADYLVRKGISDRRLEYKGYGKRMPIATNKTAVGRKKNQRVEIKILSLDG